MEDLRKYRFELYPPFFNAFGQGIALFDLGVSIVVMYLLDKYYHLSDKLPSKNKKLVYYLLLFPISIISHHIVAHYRSNCLINCQGGWPAEFTFLNKQIFTTNWNLYQLALIVILLLIYKNLNF